MSVNPRQKARDMLLKAFGTREEGQQQQSLGRVGGLTVASSVGGGGGETLQTTLGRGGSITPSSSSTVLKQRRGLRGWLSGATGRDEAADKAKLVLTRGGGFGFSLIVVGKS
jgi:hypothetical protein